ncbi:hypothetical protein J53TS2_30400 [Paenibacillus sp. J53TS2]|nr:hypothetical protein J53TS2_30400 [Paenibacillus sp. J53TS2]
MRKKRKTSRTIDSLRWHYPDQINGPRRHMPLSQPDLLKPPYPYAIVINIHQPSLGIKHQFVQICHPGLQAAVLISALFCVKISGSGNEFIKPTQH